MRLKIKEKLNTKEKKKNFLNNQNYIKYKWFSNKLSLLMKKYVFSYIFMVLSFIQLISITLYISFFNNVWSGQIILNWDNFYYSNNNIFILYISLFTLILFWVFLYKNHFKNYTSNKVNYKNITNYKLSLFLWSIWLVWTFLLYIYLNYYFILIYFIWFILILLFIFINIFSLTDIFIKLKILRPFKGYTNIDKSIKKNNLVIDNVIINDKEKRII